MGSCIGKPSCNSKRKSLSDSANNTSAIKHIANQAEVQQQICMCGKKTHEFQEHNSNTEQNQYEEIRRQIGMLSDRMHDMETLITLMQTCMCDTTQTSKESQWTTADQNIETTLKYLFTGEDPVWEKPDAPGTRVDQICTSRTPVPNGGTGTKDKPTCSSTSFAARLTSPTCSDGWTGTHAWPKSKAIQRPYVQPVSGLHRTSIQDNGTPICQQNSETHYSEE